MTDTIREPPGSPNGGQFAPNSTTPSPVSLAGRQDGTFEFPNRISDPDEFVNFHTTVHVPEENLRLLMSRHKKLRQRRVDAAIEEWDRANPVRLNSKPEEQRVRAAARELAVQEVSRAEPTIGSDIAREVAVMQRMWSCRYDLRRRDGSQVDDSEMQRLEQRRFNLSSGMGATLAGWVGYYHLDQFDALSY